MPQSHHPNHPLPHATSKYGESFRDPIPQDREQYITTKASCARKNIPHAQFPSNPFLLAPKEMT